MSDSDIIVLEPNSIYIATQPLVFGSYHWALIHCDESCKMTRHEWAQDLKLGPQSLEAYRTQELERVAATADQGTPILGYFKVTGYSPVPHSDFADLCSVAFQRGYPTVAENRAKGLTCRTWLFKVLALLNSQGHLSRSDLQEIEDAVKKRSAEADNEYATAFLWRRQFRCFLETV